MCLKLNVKALSSRRFQPREGPNRGLLRDCENRWIVCNARAVVSGVDINLDLNITLSDLTGLATLPASVPRLTWKAAEVTAVAAVTFC